jgi:hypothetical protein
VNSWHTFWEIFFELLIWVPIVLLWATALFDLISNRSIRGWANAGWAALIIFIPLVGALIYFGVRPKPPVEPVADERAATANVIEALDRAARLHDAGRLSDKEYESVKRQLVGSSTEAAGGSPA